MRYVVSSDDLVVLLRQSVKSCLGSEDPLGQSVDVARVVRRCFFNLTVEHRDEIYAEMLALLGQSNIGPRCLAEWNDAVEFYRDPWSEADEWHSYDLAPPKGQTLTYFVQAASGGPIKIGKTTGAPAKRVASLQTSHPEPLRITRVLAFDCEQEMHQTFSKFRMHGEWFSADERLAAIANAVSDRNRRADRGITQRGDAFRARVVVDGVRKTATFTSREDARAWIDQVSRSR